MSIERIEGYKGVNVISTGPVAHIVRGDMPLDGGYGEAEIVEVTDTYSGEPVRVAIDTVPQETIVKSPDSAARAAGLMLALSNNGNRGQLGFRVEYPAD